MDVTRQRREPEKGGAAGANEDSIPVQAIGPFDLPLSLAAAASFFPVAGPAPEALVSPMRADGSLSLVTVRQPSAGSSVLRASASPPLAAARLRSAAEWLISADLDLRPFYELAKSHPVLGPVTASLEGLKPLRPPALFEMAIIAITEQQLSLAAAFHIRSRLVKRFGTEIAGLQAFPLPERLAAATPEELFECGLSRRKADYVKALAQRIADGALNLEALKSQDDAAVREALLKNKGFGEWSVQYILARGFGRPDCLPAVDAGLRSVAGHYFAKGRKLTAAELDEALAPLKPYRHLAAFYLAVHWRLRRKRAKAGY